MVNAVKYWLMAAALAGAAVLGLWAHSVYAERGALRLEVAVKDSQLALAGDVQSTTSIVLSSRVQSAAAIQTKAKDVQVEILKRIPADGQCSLSGDWRVLHDAAAANEVPPATGGAAAQTVTPQVAASTVAENYAISLDNSDRLEKLQQWVRGLTDAK